MTAAPRSALQVIAIAGVVAGVLDIGFVFVYYSSVPPERILKGIARGLLGPIALAGGHRTAALGLAVHFAIALAWAAVFYALVRSFPALLRRAWQPWIVGPVFGVVVWLLMQLVVLRLLSAQPPKTFPPPGWGPVFVAHLCCVGLPLAVVTRLLLPKGGAA